MKAFVLVSLVAVLLLYYHTKAAGRDGMVELEGFLVRDHADAPSSVALLRRLASNVDRMIAHPASHDDPRMRRLREKWTAADIEETDTRADAIAHAVNKKSVALCLRDPKTHAMVDDNTAMFVLVHELAHLATPHYGHTPEFWNTMQFLLEVAEDAGVYRYVDHAQTNVSMCGHTLGQSPLACVKRGLCPATVPKKNVG